MLRPLEPIQPGFDLSPDAVDLEFDFSPECGAIAEFGEERTRIRRERRSREGIGSIDERSPREPRNPVTTDVMDHNAAKKLMSAGCEGSIIVVFLPSRIEIGEELLGFLSVVLLEPSAAKEPEEEEGRNQDESRDRPPSGGRGPPRDGFWHTDIAELLEKRRWLGFGLNGNVHVRTQLR
jgi:hypothetical protein